MARASNPSARSCSKDARAAVSSKCVRMTVAVASATLSPRASTSEEVRRSNRLAPGVVRGSASYTPSTPFAMRTTCAPISRARWAAVVSVLK